MLFAYSRTDRLIAALIFLGAASLYAATASGITSSNDGSHYALARALADRASFEITPYLSFTEDQDYAVRAGRYYSDRPPATGLLAAGFYLLGRIGPPPLALLPSKHDPDNPRLAYVALLPPLCAGGALALAYFALRHPFGRSAQAALLAVAALGTGTTIWKYGSVLYSHALALLTGMFALWLVWQITASEREGTPPAPALTALAGLALGVAPLVEYTSALFSAVVGGYLALWAFPAAQRAWSDPADRQRWLAAAGGLALGGSLPVAFLLFYNTVNFGGPLAFSRFYANIALWPENKNIATTFATPLLYGLQALTFWVPSDPNQGIFLLSPVLLAGLLGIGPALRAATRPAGLTIGLFALYLLLFSASTTFNPGTNDSRYLTSFLILWSVPLAFALDRRPVGAPGGVGAALTALAFYGLLFLSVHNQVLHIAFSWNYNLDPALLPRLAAAPDAIGLIAGTVFRNWQNLPLLWGLVGIVWLFGALSARWQALRSNPEDRLQTRPPSGSADRAA